jgi:hypothetical protein
MESVKVRIQTSAVGTFPTTLRTAAPKIWAEEGLNGFYKSLAPLWGRQIPYTMMKFACFERTIEALYMHVVPKPRAECSKGEQLIVTFAAGYIAGGELLCDNSVHSRKRLLAGFDLENPQSVLARYVKWSTDIWSPYIFQGGQSQQ